MVAISDNQQKQMMDTQEAAKKWGVTPEKVRRWCNDPEISKQIGAEHDGKGRPWRIPIDAQKPNK